MTKKEIFDPNELVRNDRRSWREDELLASGALVDFQKLCDDAFQSMRRKYFRPADLIAEVRLRKRLRIKMPMRRKSNTRQASRLITELVGKSTVKAREFLEVVLARLRFPRRLGQRQRSQSGRKDRKVDIQTPGALPVTV